MSEFSESYHLRSDSQEEAVAILRAASLQGFVYPPAGGWVTFLASDGCFEVDERITKANKGLLLHYVCAEDHGWSFAVFEKDQELLSYKCDWDEEVTYDDSNCSEEAFRKFIENHGVGSADEVYQHLKPQTIEDTFEADASRLFAEAVGLEHFEWLAYDYVESDFDDSEDFEGVIQVK